MKLTNIKFLILIQVCSNQSEQFPTDFRICSINLQKNKKNSQQIDSKSHSPEEAEVQITVYMFDKYFKSGQQTCLHFSINSYASLFVTIITVGIIIQYMSSSQNFKYAFVGVLLIGFVCCLDRSDYNVALGIFSYMLWSAQFPHKHRILWLNILATLGDLLWILVISIAEWNQEEREQNKGRGIVQIFAIVGMVYKMTLIFYAVYWIESCNDLFSWKSFKQKTLYL